MHELVAEARAAWAIARKELRVTWRYRLNAVNQVVQPIYQVLIPGVLLGATFAVGGRAVGLLETAGTDDVAGFLFLGMLALAIASTGFWGVAFTIKRELDAGTLEPAWLTPTRVETFVVGQTIAGTIVAAMTTVILLGVGVWLFGAELAPQVAVAIPVLALSVIGVLGIGYLVGALVLRMRDANFFVDAVDFIFVALSGAAFPIVVLPELVRPISYALPTTYALDIVRANALGTTPLLPIPLEWALLVVTSVVLVVIGRRVWLATERRLRVRGTVGQH